MLCYFLTLADKQLRAAAKSIKGKILVLFRRLTPALQKQSPVGMHGIASGTGYRMNMGPWCKLTNSHAPIYALFTYFRNRQ